MGRNIDTVTRRENRKGRSRGTVAWRRTASYICDYTRWGYTMTVERRERMSGGMGCIALYPVLFSIPWVHGRVFSSLTRRARARSFYSRYEPSYLSDSAHAERERKKERKVNYIMQTLRFAITSISNVSRRGIFNILCLASFRSRRSPRKIWTAHGIAIVIYNR